MLNLRKRTYSADEISLFQQECVMQHNRLRRQHGALPLKISQELQDLSEQLAWKLRKRGKLVDICNENFSCNTCHVISRNIDGNTIANLWYSEMSNYNFDQPKADDLNSRFIRMVWKSATAIGVGVSRDKNDNVFVVTLYSPGHKLTKDSLIENVMSPLF